MRFNLLGTPGFREAIPDGRQEITSEDVDKQDPNLEKSPLSTRFITGQRITFFTGSILTENALYQISISNPRPLSEQMQEFMSFEPYHRPITLERRSLELHAKCEQLWRASGRSVWANQSRR